MNNLDYKHLKIASYNSRDFNVSKKLYLDHLLREHDIVLLQERWLSDSQINDISVFTHCTLCMRSVVLTMVRFLVAGHMVGVPFFGEAH